MLALHLLHRLTVNGDEAPVNDGDQSQLPANARLMGEELLYAGNLIGLHVNEQDVGQTWRGGLLQIAEEAFLHEIDREDEHDSRAQRGQHRGRLIAGAVEIGEAVTQ